MKKIKVIFLSGLVSFLPLALTIYIVYAGVNIVENLLGQFLRRLLPEDAYYPGYGFLATIVLIFVLGLLLNNLVTAALIQRIQEKLTEIPFVKVVYSPLRDLMNLFSKGQNQSALKKVVLITINPHISVLGLVTREDFSDLQLKFSIASEKIAVYMPMSYGLGGYTLLIDKSQLQPIDLPVEKAMSLALTGWIKTENTAPEIKN
jgi:uncharacterized membrane protein